MTGPVPGSGDRAMDKVLALMKHTVSMEGDLVEGDEQ